MVSVMEIGGMSYSPQEFFIMSNCWKNGNLSSFLHYRRDVGIRIGHLCLSVGQLPMYSTVPLYGEILICQNSGDRLVTAY